MIKTLGLLVPLCCSVSYVDPARHVSHAPVGIAVVCLRLVDVVQGVISISAPATVAQWPHCCAPEPKGVNSIPGREAP